MECLSIGNGIGCVVVGGFCNLWELLKDFFDKKGVNGFDYSSFG